jgi:DNA topoisomerase-3
MERLLDDVLVGQQEMVGAIDAVCAQASRIIGRLQEGTTSVNLGQLRSTGGGGDRAPSPAMRSFVDSLVRQKGLKPPRGYTISGAVCRAFLDQHAPRTDRARLSEGAGDENLLPAPDTTATRLPPGQRNIDPAPTKAGSAQSEGRGKPGRTRAVPRKKASAGKSRAQQPGKAATMPRSTGNPDNDTPLRIPFGNKEAALQLGARYRAGGWYAPADVDLTSFRKRGWL